MTNEDITAYPAGLGRRLGAAVYDAMLLTAVLFLAAAFVLLFTAGRAIPADSVEFQLYLGGVIYLFCGWFWTHGGQTLGMRAWRLQVRSLDDSHVGWFQSGVRLVTAAAAWGLLGLGVLWCLLDPQRRSWQDIASRTRTVYLPKA